MSSMMNRRRIESIPAVPEESGLPWRRRLTGEPNLEDLLADPIMDLLLQSDGLAPGVLCGIIASAQASLRRAPCQVMSR